MKKQNIIALGIFHGLLWVGNIIAVVVNKDDAQITRYSVPAILLMAFMSVNGALAYFLRHKGNYLMFKKYRPSEFSSDKDHTYSAEYQKRFFTMLNVTSGLRAMSLPLRSVNVMILLPTRKSLFLA